MTHHVPVGVVAQDEVVGALLDRGAQHVGHPGRAHLGALVVGGDVPLRRDEQPLFAPVGRLEPTVEEVRDVRVLLRLRGAEHRLPMIGEHRGDDLGEHHRAERRRERERLVVLRHRDQRHPRPILHVEAVESLPGEGAHQLAHAIGPEVDAEHSVAGLEARRAGDDARLDEFVGLPGVVGLLDRRDGILGRGAHAVDDRVVRQLGAVPALVAVHRVVTPDHSRNNRRMAVWPYGRNEVLHERERRLRRRVPPVEERVDRDRQAGAPPQLNRGEQVRIERVDPAGADQAHQVQRAVLASSLRAQLHQRLQLIELSRLDALRDAHDVLRHHPARAEVQVPDLAVAHLSRGESHRQARRLEQRARGPLPQAVPDRRRAELDGVAVPAGTEPPAVEDDQDDRGARPTSGGHIEGHAM